MNADTVKMVAYALLKPRKATFLDEGSIRDFLLSSGTCPLENATLPEELSSLAKEILAEYIFSRDNMLGLRSIGSLSSSCCSPTKKCYII